jgi:hypothetical protein
VGLGLGAIVLGWARRERTWQTCPLLGPTRDNVMLSPGGNSGEATP